MNLNIGNIGVLVAGLRWRPIPKAEALTEAAAETMHYEYLKQNRPSTVSVMRMDGTFENYLKEVNQEATEMLETLVGSTQKRNASQNPSNARISLNGSRG